MGYWNIYKTSQERMKLDYESGVMDNPIHWLFFQW